MVPFQKAIQMMQQAGILSMNEPILQEREEAIEHLEKDVRAVADLFQDVAILVHTQGEQIDHIQSHMEVTATQMTRAARELAIIEERKRRKAQRRTRCLCMLCGVSSLLCILLMISVKKP